MKITINDTEIALKKTFRSIIAYESATGKIFNPKSVTEMIMYFYCVVAASDTTIEISYDDFMDFLDEHPTVITEFTEWLAKMNGIEDTLTKKKVSTTKKKNQ